MDTESLTERCKAGDREAMGILYRTYLQPMREVVSYYGHNNDAVWDILHDGFIIAFGSMDSLKNQKKMESWLTSIMKNLALQYVRKETHRLAIPLSDIDVENECDDYDHQHKLSWNELNTIIGKLPEGYGNVFRLAVLDGLSHKEIGALLGIAPHSSSSQLTHAKALLRRMIKKYRMEMGLLSIIGVIMLIWHWAINRREETSSTPIISSNTDKEKPFVTDSIEGTDSATNSIEPRSKMIYNVIQHHETQHNIAEITITAEAYRVLRITVLQTTL